MTNFVCSSSFFICIYISSFSRRRETEIDTIRLKRVWEMCKNKSVDTSDLSYIISLLINHFAWNWFRIFVVVTISLSLKCAWCFIFFFIRGRKIVLTKQQHYNVIINYNGFRARWENKSLIDFDFKSENTFSPLFLCHAFYGWFKRRTTKVK